MTVLVVPLEPLAPGVLPALVGDGPHAPAEPLTGEEVLSLYRAMAKDVIAAVDASGGELLVNHPAPDRAATEDPQEAARELADAAGVDAETARFEVQAGSTHAARVGNAVTHLLESEGVDTAASIDPATPLLTRTQIDGAAMRLRSAETVLGPAERGRTYYAGFAEPIDFTDAYQPPALATLAERAHDADHALDFLPRLPTVRTPGDLCSVLATLRANRVATRRLPEHTLATIEELGLGLTSTTDEDGAAAPADDPAATETGGLSLTRL